MNAGAVHAARPQHERRRHRGRGGAGIPVETAWSLHSGDGSITLQVPDDLGAELDAHTVDGHITLDKPLAVTGTISSSTVRGKLGAGGQPLRIHTGDGSIRLQRP